MIFYASEWNEAWATADRLPIWAAAYLIINERPFPEDNANRRAAAVVQGRFYPIVQLLIGGFDTGDFEADPQNARAEREGHYERTYVTREALRKFAIKRREQWHQVFDDPSSGRAQAEAECSDWLKSQIASSPEKRPKPKREYWQVAHNEWKELSRRGFDNAWNNAVNEAWKKPGKSPGAKTRKPQLRVTK